MNTTVKFILVATILFVSTELTAQSIVSIDPDTAQQGQSLAVTIDGQNTHFAQAGDVTIWLSQGTEDIYAYGYYPMDDISMVAWFDIPGDAESGSYDLHIYNNIDGTISSYDSFTITLGNIVSISPNNAPQGHLLSVAITGQNTNFAQGTDFQQGTTSNIWFSQGTTTAAISVQKAYAVDDETIIAEIFVSPDDIAGLRDLSVYNDTDGTLTLYDAFEITEDNPEITSITPNGAYQGQRLSVTITGRNTGFLQGTELQQGTETMTWFDQATPTTSVIWLTQGSSTIYSKDGAASGNTLLSAQFDIPEDANTGLWDVVVPTEHNGKVIFENGFTVAQPGDWTGDGKVSFPDFAVVAENWLAGSD